MKFRIEYTAATVAHLKALTARQQSIVLDGVANYLPMVETRHRKSMRRIPWRHGSCGSVTSAYNSTSSSSQIVVVVLAVGIKDRNVLRIGRETIELFFADHREKSCPEGHLGRPEQAWRFDVKALKH